MSASPAPRLSALPAMSSTDESAGPTQGVHEKLNTKPVISAASGEPASFETSTGSLLSRLRSSDSPNTPSWYRPSSMMRTAPALVMSCLLDAKKRPSDVMPSPSKKNEKPIPNRRVLTRSLRLEAPRS